MQKERRPTVASSKYSSIVTTRLEVVRRRAAWPMAIGTAQSSAESSGGDGGGAVVAMAAAMVAMVAAVMAVKWR